MFYLPLESVDVIPDKHCEARKAHVLWHSDRAIHSPEEGQHTFVLYLERTNKSSEEIATNYT